MSRRDRLALEEAEAQNRRLMLLLGDACKLAGRGERRGSEVLAALAEKRGIRLEGPARRDELEWACMTAGSARQFLKAWDRYKVYMRVKPRPS